MSYPISSSLLDGIVLAVVERESTYGYRITQDVQKVLDISESTLYPVLRRLMKDGCLTTYDQAYAGRNRWYDCIRTTKPETPINTTFFVGQVFSGCVLIRTTCSQNR